MSRHATIIWMLIILMTVAFSAHAQKATEIFIPIGKSPGLGGKATTVQGKIERVDLQKRTIAMKAATDSYTIKATKQTQIYLDNSKAQRPNTHGTLADCKVGELIEVKWKDNDRTKAIEWIKVQKLQ